MVGFPDSELWTWCLRFKPRARVQGMSLRVQSSVQYSGFIFFRGKVGFRVKDLGFEAKNLFRVLMNDQALSAVF